MNNHEPVLALLPSKRSSKSSSRNLDKCDHQAFATNYLLQISLSCRFGVWNHLCSSSTGAGNQEGNSLVDAGSVGKMSSSDGEGAGADQVAAVADDEGAVSWVVWNASVVLLVAGVTVGNGTKDAGLDCGRAVLNGAVDESGTLAV